MIAAIHQPNFLPWLGYFYKMLKCDRFVFLDDVQFIRRGFTSRVRIKTQSGVKWLTVPVQKKGRYEQTVSEVRLEPGAHWKNKVLGTLQSYYGKAPYFKSCFPQIEEIVHRDYQLMAELNIQLIKWLARVLEIDTPMVRASELEGVSGHSSQRLATICKAIGAKEYLSGFGGRKYQEQEIFQQHDLKLMISGFQHPTYPQMWEEFEFVPGLSTVDLLFNCGPESPGVLKEIG
ncbi:MAG: WbqC family protein [bacterium]|nr:WbqC family protein [bacterium]